MKETTRKQKPKHRRRILRFLLWFSGILLFLIVGIHIAVRILLPEDAVRALLAGEIQKTTGRSFSVDRLSWSLFGSLEAEGVRVGFTPEEQMPDSLFFSLEEARVRFRLLPLLRRRFEVSEIALIRPRLSLTPLFLAGSDGPARAAVPDSVPAADPSLPVSVNISRFNLEDFDLKVALPDTVRNPEIILTRLNIDLRDLRMPRGFPGSFDGAKGALRFFGNKSRLIYRDTEIGLAYHPDVEWVMDIADSLWNLKGRILLTRPGRDRADLALHLQGRGGGAPGWVHLDMWTLDVDGQRFLDVTGRAETAGKTPAFHMTFGGAAVDLARVRDFLVDMLPPVFSGHLEPYTVAGSWRPLYGEISGRPDDMHVELRSSATGLAFSGEDGPFAADGLGLEVSLRGALGTDGLKAGHVLGDLSLGAARLSLNDTTALTLKDIVLSLRSELNPQFLPVRGEAEGRIGNLLAGAAGFRVDWRAEALPDLSALSARFQLNMDGLDLTVLPLPEPVLGGRFGLALSGTVDGPSDIRARLTAETGGLAIRAGMMDPVPDIALESRWRLGMSPDFSRIFLDTVSLKIDSLLTAEGSGEVSLSDALFEATLAEISVENRAVAAHLPKSMRMLMEDFSFFGRETATLRIEGAFGPDTLTVNLAGEAVLSGVGLTDHRQGTRLRDIGGTIRFAGTPARIDADASVRLGSLEYPLLMAGPAEEIRLDMEFGWNAPASIRVPSATLTAPSLGVTAGMRFSAVPADTSLDIEGMIRAAFLAEEWISPLHDLALRGRAEAVFDLATLDPARRHLRLSGILESDGLCLKQDAVFRVAGIRGRVPVQLDLDLGRGTLLSDPSYQPLSPVDYDRRRDWIASISPVVENFVVDTITVAGYALHGLTMDLDLRYGRLHIPRFHANLFEGGVGGSLWIDPGDGNPENIRYGIRAQASRINSAALLGDRSIRTATELNANLSFTGIGVTPESGMELTGSFHITRIGPRFASTLLRGLDPQGSDRSIRLTRRLLDMGWQPRLFSFELRHGHVYPSLSLSQPWFSPVRIPGRLEYGRLPLAFFLTTKTFSTR
ncbi:MAG TPA: AsmA family protein [bacterium]|nr:AsmA family protein [bacterium]